MGTGMKIKGQPQRNQDLSLSAYYQTKPSPDVLLKRRQLKGKKLVILEDMGPDLAKRLKRLKEKRSVETAWFSDGKIKYKYKDDPKVLELGGWMALHNIE